MGQNKAVSLRAREMEGRMSGAIYDLVKARVSALDAAIIAWFFPRSTVFFAINPTEPFLTQFQFFPHYFSPITEPFLTFEPNHFSPLKKFLL